jgi:hypothetical protein
MNERIKELAQQSGAYFGAASKDYFGEEYPAFVSTGRMDIEKFAELIVEECRQVVADLYRNTPLEFCGPLLTADEKIAEHFFRITK